MSKWSFAMAFLGLLLGVGCFSDRTGDDQPLHWKFSHEIPLQGIAPIGIVSQPDNALWVSDVAYNRVLKLDQKGLILEQYSGFERPMHLAFKEGKLYIPEYTSDTIKMLINGQISTYSFDHATDAIAGIALDEERVVIADFYHHHVVLKRGKNEQIIGSKGHEDGQLYYPTDVAIHKDKIYVADAYNNRVQVFDLSGKYIQMIGWQDNIQVATGIKVTDAQIMVADFDGDRVLVYAQDGSLLQVLDQHFNKPTDMEIFDNQLYIVNYAGQSISVFTGQSNGTDDKTTLELIRR